MPTIKVRACATSNIINKEPKIVKQDKEEQAKVDNLIQQAMVNEPFLSYSRARDSPLHLIQLLHSFDQQGNGKPSKSPKGDNDVELKDNPLELFNGNKETANSFNNYGAHVKGIKNAYAPMQNLKIPDAVVAFAQAAAKASSDPEKLDISGWPFVSTSKTQLHKCDKCSREFCSSINYRRHIRVHRRSLNVAKDSPKNKDLLAAFWDKLSVEETKELVSLKNVFMEEVSGPTVIKALSTWLRWPGMFSSLSHVYIKAGLMLLEVVQASSSVFPISSQELFRLLDDASEKTFLCAGTALSLQKYVFDGEVTKNALEMKNLIACTSFLIEKELVKAWLVDKDAEALRCQKLLFEEEEAAQKRKAELLEKRRLKKLRQKEQKEKETLNGMKDDFKAPSPNSATCTGSTEASSPRASSEYCTSEASVNLDHQLLDSTALCGAEGELRLGLSLQNGNSEKNKIDQAQTRNYFSVPNAMTDGKNLRLPLDSDSVEQDVAYQTQLEIHHQQPNHVRLRVCYKPTRNIHEAIIADQPSSVRSSVSTRYINTRNVKAISQINGNKVWTIKSRPDDEEDGKNGRCMLDRELGDGPVVSHQTEVLIGSINVALGNDDGHHPYTILRPQFQENSTKLDSSLSSASQTTVKQWRPVSCHGNGVVIQNDSRDAKVDVPYCRSDEQTISDESCVASGLTSDTYFERCEGPMLFSSEVAKAFLTQRWKEAIARDDTVVASSSEAEAFRVHVETKDATASPQLASFHAENQPEWAKATDPIPAVSLKLKLNRPKAEKASKFKYVPKQKVNAAEEYN
ncbi:hypothetical protein AXF42_Ash019590 [Apostasia shenzhenica]|uniref:C2H2-type domain-containing protein n=1 Tax=Apostasia shenzhenica TaxID=1088818 RepID=A0A2I0AV98_9ASPA|nr:hypothetical protein AXF42_Ash019590 [Apostasia shenzhenica]